MVTFNELLRANGVDPADVALLRHSGKGRLGLTPYDLLQNGDGLLDRYQCTQDPRKRVFKLPYWASFVSNPANETLFVGLYSAKRDDNVEIDWLCPMSGLPPGAEKGRASAYYQLTILDILREDCGKLKIQWDRGWVSWARHAGRNEHLVLGDVDLAAIDEFAGSPEGNVRWEVQLRTERNSRVAQAALSRNATDHGGHFGCEACNFRHPDRAMFDAHHIHPLVAGPRMTRTSDFVILCPTCHRRAHRSDNRMLPFNLIELRAWNDSGRP